MPKKPTAAQLKVLRAMGTGAVMIWRIGERPFLKLPSGAAVNLMRKTALWLINGRMVTQVGTIGAHWYELTDSGRSILMKEKT